MCLLSARAAVLLVPVVPVLWCLPETISPHFSQGKHLNSSVESDSFPWKLWILQESHFIAENSSPALQRNLDLFFSVQMKNPLASAQPGTSAPPLCTLGCSQPAASCSPKRSLQDPVLCCKGHQITPRNSLLRSWEITLLHVSAAMLK